jgi:hypothetical protein
MPIQMEILIPRTTPMAQKPDAEQKPDLDEKGFVELDSTHRGQNPQAKPLEKRTDLDAQLLERVSTSKPATPA